MTWSSSPAACAGESSGAGGPEPAAPFDETEPRDGAAVDDGAAPDGEAAVDDGAAGAETDGAALGTSGTPGGGPGG